MLAHLDYHVRHLNETFARVDLRGFVPEKPTPFELGIEIDNQITWFCKDHSDTYASGTCIHGVPLGKTFQLIFKANFIHGSTKLDTIHVNPDHSVSTVPPREFIPDPPENPWKFGIKQSWEDPYQSPTMILQGLFSCILYPLPTIPPGQ
uniref:Arrestin-like N-terminal domain-containing protein n=1 Tax=Panagrolaimus sp. JU765 TaxID=591449 RepID=A0AC34QLC1_9BILA